MKILLLTHGQLAEGLLHSVTMLIGTLSDVDFISFSESMGIEALTEDVREYLNNNNDESILIMTDIMGGTPFNVASMESYENERIAVFYGINLPLFVEAYMNKDMMTFEELVNYLDGIKNETIGKSNL
ncbi:MAG: PTS sugar transporter subunit IIA [Eubacteriales bacterium]|nr:PTS sugar transporter subunit IIA [Eubacteriales bacterium]